MQNFTDMTDMKDMVAMQNQIDYLAHNLSRPSMVRAPKSYSKPIDRTLLILFFALLLFSITTLFYSFLWPETIVLSALFVCRMIQLKRNNGLPVSIDVALWSGGFIFNGVLAILLSTSASFFPFALLFIVFFVSTLLDHFLSKENEIEPSATLKKFHYALKIGEVILSLGLLILLRIALDPSILLALPLLVPLLQGGSMLQYAIIINCSLILLNALLELARVPNQNRPLPQQDIQSLRGRGVAPRLLRAQTHDPTMSQNYQEEQRGRRYDNRPTSRASRAEQAMF